MIFAGDPYHGMPSHVKVLKDLRQHAHAFTFHRPSRMAWSICEIGFILLYWMQRLCAEAYSSSCRVMQLQCITSAWRLRSEKPSEIVIFSGSMTHGSQNIEGWVTNKDCFKSCGGLIRTAVWMGWKVLIDLLDPSRLQS